LKLIDFIPASAVVHRLSASDAAGAIRELAAALGRAHALDAGAVETLLLAREQLGSTALGHGIAAPHGRMDVARTMGALGLSEKGVDFAATDGIKARIVVAFVSPRQAGGDLRALAVVAQTFADPTLRQELLESASAADVHRLLSSSRGKPRSRGSHAH
jgi:PTS system nitrogen regulatory IIA component